jgi:hypothetical protein
MLKTKTILFIDALLTFFENNNQIYGRLIYYHHVFQNVLTETEIQNIFSKVQFNITHKHFNFDNLVYQKDYELLLKHTNNKDQDKIWNWLTSIIKELK